MDGHNEQRLQWATHHAAPAVPSGCFMTNLPMMSEDQRKEVE
jgi:hypothetical protein